MPAVAGIAGMYCSLPRMWALIRSMSMPPIEELQLGRLELNHGPDMHVGAG